MTIFNMDPLHKSSETRNPFQLSFKIAFVFDLSNHYTPKKSIDILNAKKYLYVAANSTSQQRHLCTYRTKTGSFLFVSVPPENNGKQRDSSESKQTTTAGIMRRLGMVLLVLLTLVAWLLALDAGGWDGGAKMGRRRRVGEGEERTQKRALP